MLDWLGDNETLVFWLFVLSVLTFVGTLVALPILIVRMPADYFDHRNPPPDSWRGRHPAVRIAVLVAKNILGWLLIALGILLSVPLVPGQGFLTILIGLTLLNFPGKRTLERKLIGNRAVLPAVNAIRAKAGRPPLHIPDE